MAQKIVTVFTDDLTGDESPDVETHSLALDGVSYEVDLGPDSYDKLLDGIGPFIGAARRVGGRARGGSAARKAQPEGGDGGETARIRAWAKENGYEVNDRGRVPAPIREAYGKAN